MNKTQTKKKLFLEEFENTLCNISETCKKVGINRGTYYNWINKDAIFKEKVIDLQDSVLDFVESQLYKRIENEDLTAIIFYLKTKGKHRGYREKFDISSNINNNQNNKIEKIEIEFIE